MKILLLSAYFPPEIGSASHLFYELGREFVRRGHRVTVLTGYPTYNVDVQKLPPRYESGWWMRESVEGMHVVRIRTIGMPRQIPVLRGVGQITLSMALSFSGLFLDRERADVMVVYSPPLFLGLAALLLRPFKGAMAVLNVQDLFPQSAIDLGLLRNKMLIGLFRRIESYLYKRVNAVTVHSPGNKEHVVRCGGRSEKTFVVPNLVDTKELAPGERVNAFRERYEITKDKFVVSFAGVIGLSQDLDVVIDAAKILRDQPDITFYIVGDGMEKARLVKRAEGMTNVCFLPMLSKREYTELLHASDVCLVTLRKEVRTPVVPSKVLSIMAAGRAVIASLPLAGDAPAIIREAQCGLCVQPESPSGLSEAIESMYKNPDETLRYGRNGRTFVEKNFSAEVCTSLYEQIFNRIVNREGKER
jgi:glycosyltransferase involved in cell wall biosynthesis